IVIVLKGIIAKHHALHQFPAVLEIHCITGSLTTVALKMIVLNDPTNTATIDHAERAIVNQAIVVKMHIARHLEVGNAPAVASAGAAVMSGLSGDFRLIELQMDIMRPNRHLNLAKLLIVLPLDETHVL